MTFISSEVVLAPRPWQTAYSACKAGTEALARALSLELEGSGVRVTTIRVGATGSEFASDWPAERIRSLLEDWNRFGIQRHLALLSSDHVAAAVVNAVTAPPGVQLGIIEVRPEAPKSEE